MYTTLIVEGKKYNISESQIRKVYREELQTLALERYVPILESLEQKYKNNLISESQYHELTEGVFDTIKDFIKAGLSKLGAGITRIKAPAALGRIRTDNQWINDKHLQQQTDKFVKQLADGADEGILQSKLVSFYKGRNISPEDSRIIATYIVKNAKKAATDAAKAAGAPPQAVSQAAQAAQITPSTTSRAFDTAQNRTDSPLSAPNAAMAALRGTGAAQQAATTDTTKAAQPAPEAGAAQAKSSPATATDVGAEKNRTPADNAFRALVNAAKPIIIKNKNIKPLYDDIVSYLGGGKPKVGAQQATPLAKITDFDNLRINEKKYLKLKEATPEDQVVVGKGSESYALTGIIKKSILKNNLIDKTNKKLAPGVDELIKAIYNSLSKYGLMKQQSKFNPSNITFDNVMSSGSSIDQRLAAAPASSYPDLESPDIPAEKQATAAATTPEAAPAADKKPVADNSSSSEEVEVDITDAFAEVNISSKLDSIIRNTLQSLTLTEQGLSDLKSSAIEAIKQYISQNQIYKNAGIEIKEAVGDNQNSPTNIFKTIAKAKESLRKYFTRDNRDNVEKLEKFFTEVFKIFNESEIAKRLREKGNLKKITESKQPLFKKRGNMFVLKG